MGGNLKDLPTDIVLDIITRLPIESILECKLVCRPWRCLVSNHPSFSRLHLARINQSADFGKLSFIVLNEGKHLYYLEYDENNDETPIDSIRRINFTPPFRYVGYQVFESINGLVCLHQGYEASTCICNPVTREYVKLPKFIRDSDSDLYHPWSRGFGYLPLTNEYKVVEIDMLKGELSIEVRVYTVGSSNGWRNVGRFDLNSGDTIVDDFGVFMNGALHWVNKTGGMVFVFDLMEEKFREHVSPPPKPLGNFWYGYSIGVFGGILYYSIQYGHQLNETNCDIWVWKKKSDVSDMKEQVEQETMGWSQE